MPEHPIDDDEPAGGAAADGVGCGDQQPPRPQAAESPWIDEDDDPPPF